MKSITNYRDYGRLWRVYGRSVFRYGASKKIWNALRTELAYRRQQVNVRTSPYLLFMEPLYYCNLHCPLCQRQTWKDARKKDAGRMPLNLADKILDEIGDYLFQCQLFGLGEPLLDWPLTSEIIRRCHRRRIFTLVSTNCTLITPQMAEEIVTSGLDYLVCAIDGTSQESYSQYRVGGSVEKALEGLRLVAEARDRHRSSLFVEWQFLVHRFDAQEVEAARKMAKELKVYIRFAPLGGMEWSNELQEYWLPETEKWQDGRLKPGETRNEFPCYWLWRSLVVNSNGQLARCPGYQNVAQMGHLQEHSIMSLYNGPQSQRARELFRKGEVPTGEFPLPCNNCSFYHREHGGPNLDKPSSLVRQETDATFIPIDTLLPM